MKNNREFWNKEYKNGQHLTLSENPSEDMIKFVRFLERRSGRSLLNPTTSVLDLGCGNGRNLIYFAQNFGMRGIGYDISSEAVEIAKKLSVGFSIEYQTRSIVGPLDLPDLSQTLVLDMMTSHFLNQKERSELMAEIVRVMKPNGWLFLKTFLLDGDKHAERLLRESPAAETGSYIHPKIGVAEHVFTEDEIREILEPNFVIHKIEKSHRHQASGKAFKRRSMSVYAEKI